MAKNKNKQRNMGVPIESHQTASWANISDMKPVSRVPIPNTIEVKNAKEYVDTNQK